MVKIKFYHISFYTTLLFFFHFSVNAQKFTASIHGRILNNDGKPAQSVTVELQRLNKLTFSDNNGFFIMSHLQPGNDSLIISSTEFKTLKLPVLIKDGVATDIGVIHLQYNMPELQSVEIKGRTLQS